MSDCDLNFVIGDSTDLLANIIETDIISFSVSDIQDLNYSLSDGSDLSYVIDNINTLSYSISTVESLDFTIDVEPQDLNFSLVDFVTSVLVFENTEEEAVAFASRVDSVGDNFIYKGEAIPGTDDATPLWRIKRVEFIGDDVEVTWAQGQETFNKIWDNRLSYTYS